jgi:hypothetical protein
MVRRRAHVDRVGRPVGEHQAQRIEHGDRAWRARLEIVAQCLLEHAHVDPGVGTGHADAFAEQPYGLGRVAAAAQAHERGHARVVPAVDPTRRDQLLQPALARDGVAEVEPREFDLSRQRPREEAALGQPLEQPVVERTMVLELERADRVGDVLERIG